MRGLISSGAYHALSPLDTLIVSHIRGFVKRNFSEPNIAFFALGVTRVFIESCSLLTLQIIPHLSPDCNRQNAQNWDFYFLDICATFRLTNCWRCVIMEICAPHTRGRAAEILCIMYKKPTAFVSRSQKRWGNSIQKLAISGATPIAFS